MHKLLCAVGVAVGLVGLNGSVAEASHTSPGTVYVDDDNCPGPGTGTLADPFCKIQDALTHASAGDTIRVAAGTYSEPTGSCSGSSGNQAMFCVDKGVTLRGDPGNETFGPGVNAPVVDGQGAAASGFAIGTGVSNVVIEGFEIMNFANPGYEEGVTCSLGTGGIGTGILSWNTGATNVTVRHNFLHDLGWNGVLAGSDDGTVLSGWLVTRNRIANALYAGIELTNVSDSTVHLNTITPRTGTCIIDPGDSGVGIEVAVRDRGTGVTASDVNVTQNYVTGALFDRAGINILSRAYVDGAQAVLTGVTVLRNRVIGGNATGILVTGESRTATSSAEISGLASSRNIVRENADGIVLRDCGNFDCSTPDPVGTVTFQNNEVDHNTALSNSGSGQGIHLGEGANGTTVLGNNARDNGAHGLLVESNNNLIMTNRLLENGADGIHLAVGTTGNQVIKNTVNRNTDDGIEDAGSNTCPTSGPSRNVALSNGDNNFVGCP